VGSNIFTGAWFMPSPIDEGPKRSLGPFPAKPSASFGSSSAGTAPWVGEFFYAAHCAQCRLGAATLISNHAMGWR